MADDTRLDGWKAIGNHLGRDRTTALRWTRERGLPVHRIPGGRTGTVYALRSELNDWLANGAPLPRSEPEDVGFAAAPASSRRWIAYLLAAACAAAIAGLLVWRQSHAGDPPVGIAAVVSAHDDKTTRRFARELTADLARFANASAGLAVYDGDGDGGASSRVQYGVRSSIEGVAPGLIVRVWLTSTDDDSVLWSRRIEQSVPEIAVLRERVAANVIGILRCSLGALAGERATIKPPELALLLSICQAMLDADYPPALAQARDLTAARPDLATAWAAMALVESALAGSDGDPALRGHARTHARRAAAIAPDHIATRVAAVAAAGESSPLALPVVEQALRSHPDDPRLLRQWSLMLFNAGYVRASVEPALRAMRSDPTWMGGRDSAVRRLAAAGRLDEALQVQRENERLWPHYPQIARERARLTAQATTASHDLLRTWLLPDTPHADAAALDREARARPYIAYAIAHVRDGEGDRRSALAWLARAPEDASALHQWSILFWPSAAGLRTEPAFFRKMAKLGLVDIWVARKQWPDFCSEEELRYDCAAEAAKLAH